VVGDDSFAAMIRKSLTDENVDVGGLIERPGTASQFAFIVAAPVEGSRTVFWRRPTGAPPAPDEIDFDALRGSRLFYTDGLLIDAALAAAREAKSAGIPVVVDPGSMRDGMLDLARESDCFVVSEKFAREMTGQDRPGGEPLDPRAAHDVCREIAALGPTVAGVTLGSRGYVALVGGRIIERPAHDVTPIDTTGCGDVFHAGLALGVLRGWSPERSLDFGAWAAAMVSGELGGRSGIPPLSAYPGQP
jgi:ribokinase